MTTKRPPTPLEAERFAALLHAGLPPHHAIKAFLPPALTADEVSVWMQEWVRDAQVGVAIEKLQGGRWEELQLGQRVDLALIKQYSEMAYIMIVNHYDTANPQTQRVLDTCRATLETYQAGMAGRVDPLKEFFQTLIAEKQAEKEAALKLAEKHAEEAWGRVPVV